MFPGQHPGAGRVQLRRAAQGARASHRRRDSLAPSRHHDRGDAASASSGRPAKVSLVGLGGFHIGMPKDEAESDPHHPHARSIAASTSSTTAGTTTTARARSAWARRSRRLPREGLPHDEDRRAHARRPPTSRSSSRLKRLQTDRIDLVQIHEVIRIERPGARLRARRRASRRWSRRRRPARSASSASPGTRTRSIHLAMLEGGRRARLRASTPCRCRST